MEIVEQWSDFNRFFFVVYLPSYKGVHWDDLAWERWMESYALEGSPGISPVIQDSLWCRHPNLTPFSLGATELKDAQVMSSSGSGSGARLGCVDD